MKKEKPSLESLGSIKIDNLKIIFSFGDIFQEEGEAFVVEGLETISSAYKKNKPVKFRQF